MSCCIAGSIKVAACHDVILIQENPLLQYIPRIVHCIMTALARDLG